MTSTAPAEYADVELGLIDPHLRNVRQDLGDLTELAASVAERGIVEPLILAPAEDGRYTIVAGHRRHGAAQIAALTTVPAIIRHDLTTDVDVLVTMLVENGHRADLTPIEEAVAYEQLGIAGLGEADIAKRTGRSRSTVASRLSLMTLPEPARDKVHARQLSLRDAERVAAALARFPGDEKLAKAVERLVENGYSDYELARLVEAAETRARRTAAAAEARAAGLTVMEASAVPWENNPARWHLSTEQHAEQCDHHAVYITPGAYVSGWCLHPESHGSPAESVSIPGENLDVTGATVARGDATDAEALASLQAAREAEAARRAQEEAERAEHETNVKAAAGLRREFVRDFAQGARKLTAPQQAAVMLAVLRWWAIQEILEPDLERLLEDLGHDLDPEADQSAGPDSPFIHLVQEQFAKRPAAGLLACIADVAESDLGQGWAWRPQSYRLQAGETDRLYLDLLIDLGYERPEWEVAAIAAVDARVAREAEQAAAREAVGAE